MEKKLFLHTADLHLDSALKNLGDAAKAAVRRRELTDTFARMAEYASSNGVSGVIVAGDMFDEGKTSAAAKRQAAEIMKKNGGVRFFCSAATMTKERLTTILRRRCPPTRWCWLTAKQLISARTP